MVQSAGLTVLLADDTKFGRRAAFAYADLDAVDVLVRVSEADADCLMSAANIELLRA